MTIRNLDRMFRPRSVAVIGASNDVTKVGHRVMRHLLDGRFAGPILPVNPHATAVCGVLAYKDVAALPITPDLGIICTKAVTVPGMVEALGARGTRAAVVMSGGLDRAGPDSLGRSLTQAMLDAARPHTMRILGSDSVGLMVPALGLNATLAPQPGKPGHIAFVTQSRSIASAVLDWARSRGIGFSHLVSLGRSADVDVGDMLDYLGQDPDINAILLYIEEAGNARKFLSAGRAAARNKQVVVIRGGRAGLMVDFGRAVSSIATDAVYDAAIQRAGMLRVYEIDELFFAVETLARAEKPVAGARLAIFANGGGPGILAGDTLLLGGGSLAPLGEATLDKLDALLPAGWSRTNPVNVPAEIGAQDYIAAMAAVAADPNVDALLAMHAPVTGAESTEMARAVIAAAAEARCNILTSWLGAENAAPARRLFVAAGLPTYDTPGDAVRAFLHLINYRRNQEMLMETPASAPADFTPDIDTARRIVQTALLDGREFLTEPEAKALLAAYDIPAVPTYFVEDSDAAVDRACKIGFPVALKILSPDVSDKDDVGGVALDIETPDALVDAVSSVTGRVKRHLPEARIVGYTVQPMIRRPGAHELYAAMTVDPVFGPVILFGRGGAEADLSGDRAVGLPPLNMALAGRLIERTRIFRALQGGRERKPAKLDAVCLTLIQIAQVAVDLPDVVALEIDSLSADDQGVIALDAKVRVARAGSAGPRRLAIRPYPRELEEWTRMKDKREILLRPIRPEDEPAHAKLFEKITPEDRRMRFFNAVRELSHRELARFTQMDYDREMAFIAHLPKDDRNAKIRGKGDPGDTLGVVRCAFDPDGKTGEFAIALRSDMKGLGLGKILMRKMIDYCRARGSASMFGEVLSENDSMRGLAKSLGFKTAKSDDPRTVKVVLELG